MGIPGGGSDEVGDWEVWRPVYGHEVGHFKEEVRPQGGEEGFSTEACVFKRLLPV